MSRRFHRPRLIVGYTLIELMIALAVSTLVVAVTLSLYLTVTGSVRRQTDSRREEALQALDVVRRDLACALPTAATSTPPFALEVADDFLGASSNADLTMTVASLDAPQAAFAQMEVWRVRYRLAPAPAPETNAVLVREAVRLDAPSQGFANATSTLFRGAALFEVNVLAGTTWGNRWRPTSRAPVPTAANIRLGWQAARTTETAEAWTVIPAALALPGPSRRKAAAP